MKKIIVFIVGIIIAFFSFSAAAQENIIVKLNGAKMDFDVQPVIQNDRTLVPFRKIFEALDCAVSYSKTQDGEYVTAMRGFTQIFLKIGSNEMVVNGETVILDVAPEIINDRTLVPLRAVSESLNAQVDMNEETNTVSIVKQDGQYKIASATIDKTIYADDNTLLLTISCSYPIIENEQNDIFFNYINNEYKQNAESYVKNIEDEYAADAEMMRSEMTEGQYRPMDFCLSYDVTLNRKNLISITTLDYRNANGAHPNSLKTSRTFHMLLNKELSLMDILGNEQPDTDKTVINSFTDLLKNDDYYTEDMANAIKDEAKNVNFYLTNNALVMYFNPYDIAPYAYGSPTVTLPFSGPDGVVKIDLSGYELDKLEFELEGNPTTGYSWETEADNLEVENEYISDENKNDLVGVGGKYKFIATGKKEGNATLKCMYMRSFEGKESAIKTVEYKLYVSKDSKITIVSYDEKSSD